MSLLSCREGFVVVGPGFGESPLSSGDVWGDRRGGGPRLKTPQVWVMDGRAHGKTLD